MSTQPSLRVHPLATPLTLLFMVGLIIVTKIEPGPVQYIGYGLMAVAFGIIAGLALR